MSTEDKKHIRKKAIDTRTKNNPDWRKDLSDRMLGENNPSKSKEVIENIAESKSNWNDSFREYVISKNSGINHYRNNPNYKSTQFGKGHPNYNPNAYSFKNKNTLEEVRMTVFDFIKTYNLHQGNVSLLMSGKRKSVRGWMLS